MTGPPPGPTGALTASHSTTLDGQAPAETRNRPMAASTDGSTR